MFLQCFRSFSKLASERFVVVLIGNSPKEINAVKLMEYFNAHPIAFLSRLGIVDFERRVRHPKLVNVCFRDPLVSHCQDHVSLCGTE